MKIPSSIEDATLDLKGLGELITASEWKRAAIVWAFTEDRKPGRKSATSGRLSAVELASQGIAGLTSHTSVTKYRKAWAKAIADGVATDVKPGDVIELPAVEWQTYFTPVDREVTGQDGNTHERQEREWNPPPGAPLGNDRASASLLCDSDDFPSTLKLVGKNINNLLAAYTLNLTQIEQVEGLLHKTLRTLGKRKAELNPPMPKLGDKPGRKQTPAVEPWDESSWQPEKINESKRLVKLNDMMWNTLDGLDDTEGEMLKRIGKSILDFIEDENKVRGVARLMHSVIEFASVYKSKRR